MCSCNLKWSYGRVISQNIAVRCLLSWMDQTCWRFRLSCVVRSNKEKHCSIHIRESEMVWRWSWLECYSPNEKFMLFIRMNICFWKTLCVNKTGSVLCRNIFWEQFCAQIILFNKNLENVIGYNKNVFLKLSNNTALFNEEKHCILQLH